MAEHIDSSKGYAQGLHGCGKQGVRAVFCDTKTPPFNMMKQVRGTHFGITDVGRYSTCQVSRAFLFRRSESRGFGGDGDKGSQAATNAAGASDVACPWPNVSHVIMILYLC